MVVGGGSGACGSLTFTVCKISVMCSHTKTNPVMKVCKRIDLQHKASLN